MTDVSRAQGEDNVAGRGGLAAAALLLVVGGVAAWQSALYGLGQWSAPGPGFLPFGASLLILALALVLLTRELRSRVTLGPATVSAGKSVRDVAAVVVAMLAYAALLSVLGFLLTTALFMAFLLKFVGHKGWLVTALVSVSVAVAAHILFVVLLAVQMPVWPLGL